ncbi:MAG: HAD family hydrolase [Bacteroidales bacterium]|nr:HAD family hydrolase [Bacteroidales bacterium]
MNTVVFDLDGTLLDTLTDLSNAVNHALREHGLPERTTAEVRSFLGNGIRFLMEHAVGEHLGECDFEQVFASFRAYYVAHCLDFTAPYPGIMPLLAELKARGVRMAIVSNKLHPAVQSLNQRFFADYVTSAVGESATVRRKPCPDAVMAALRELDSSPSEAIYVGDSEVDLETSQRAGLPCALCLWGFRDEDFLRKLPGASLFLRQPSDLLSLV